MSLVIHIGLPKTATTTLQDCFFSKHSSIHYLGKPYSNSSVGPSIHAMRLMDDIEYATVAQMHVEAAKQALACVTSDRLVTVLSDEALSATGGTDRALIAKRLREAFGEARILITIRRQADAIESQYGEYLRRVSPDSGLRYYSFSQFVETCYVRYFRPRRQGMRKQYFHTSAITVGNPLCELKYFELAETYRRVFGRDQVGIFVFEQLRENPIAFYGSLTSFLRIDPALMSEDCLKSRRNESPSPVAVMEKRFPALAKVKNALPHPLVGAVRRCVPRRKPILTWNEEMRAQVDEIFKEGNSALSRDYGLALKDYGYSL